MDNHEKRFEENSHLQTIVDCAIYYQKGYKYKDIARKLDISVVSVSRHIKSALDRGILKMQLFPPQANEVAFQIRHIYKLNEVLVFPIGVEEEIAEMLAKLSASYLDELLDNNQDEIKRIAIGPGEIMLNLANGLSKQIRAKVFVRSTNSATLTENYKSSNTLIAIIAGKWRCQLDRFDSKISSDDQKDYADVLIFEIDQIPDMLAALDLGMDKIDRSELEKRIHKLLANEADGFINYQPINEQGNPLQWDISDYFNEGTLKLDVIKKIARNKNKRVVCVSGGQNNERAIKAALKGGYFNVLITDIGTAMKLLE